MTSLSVNLNKVALLRNTRTLGSHAPALPFDSPPTVQRLSAIV